MTKLDDALQVMEFAHHGQTRRDGITPYSVHPKRVVKILKYYGIDDEDMLIAGYLHDVLEDTDFKREVIESKFGSRVLSLIDELTFVTDDANKYIEHASKLSQDAKWIKLSDILSNLEDDGEKSSTYVSKRIKALQLILKDLF